MRQRDTLISAAVVGFTQHTSVSLSHCPSYFLHPPVPLYLPFYRRHVGMQRDQAQEDEGKDKG